MPPRVLIVEPEAEEELAGAMDWYERKQPGLGAALLSEVEEIFAALERDELAGVTVPKVRTTLPVRRVCSIAFPTRLFSSSTRSACT